MEKNDSLEVILDNTDKKSAGKKCSTFMAYLLFGLSAGMFTLKILDYFGVNLGFVDTDEVSYEVLLAGLGLSGIFGLCGRKKNKEDNYQKNNNSKEDVFY